MFGVQDSSLAKIRQQSAVAVGDSFFLLDLFGVWTLASGHAVRTLNPEP